MKRDSNRWWKPRGLHVVRPVASDEGNASFFYEIGNICVVSCKPGGVGPRSERASPFPAASIEQYDVARGHLHALQLLQRLEVFAMDRCPRFQPTLRSSFSRQARRIEKDASGNDAIFQSIDISLRTATCGLDVLHRSPVVSLAVDHDVTVHGIQVTVNHAVIRAGVLVSIGGAGGTDVT